MNFIGLTIRTGALSFYENAIRSSALLHYVLLQEYSGRFDYPTCGEDNKKVLTTHALATT